jgi:NAD(P)H dehydrogenase (quinone)
MANILLVHAHHEPRSFCSAIARTAAEALTAQGHHVQISDLHAMNFQPVSDRRNFATTANAGYLKQQQEEAHATQHLGFAPELEAEIRKLESCDMLIFCFPLWWFSMPAILKGWVDRIFAYQRIYGRGHWYENGLGKNKRRAMVLMTTGGDADMYAPGSLHPAMDQILVPIHHGIFRFNGFVPLPPFIAWAAAHGTDADRSAVLDSLRERMVADVLLSDTPAPGPCARARVI